MDAITSEPTQAYASYNLELTPPADASGRLPVRLHTAAALAAGLLVLACLWLVVAAAMNGGPIMMVLPRSQPVVIATLGGVGTAMLGALLLLLHVETRRRVDHKMRLAYERAMLAAEMRRGGQMQEQLKASEARLRDFARMASDWFWEQDAELRFTSIGMETPLLLPGDRSHIGRRRWEMNDTSKNPDYWEKHKRDLLERKPFRDFRYSRVGPDGQLLHVSINGVPVFDDEGTFIGYRGTGRDITHEVNAAAELQQAKERAEKAETLLRDAVDSISEGFVIYDQHDRLVLCNEAYRTLYPESARWMVAGSTFEEIVRKGLKGGDYPDMVARQEEYLAERLARHREASGELEQRLVNGRWVLITERRMRNGGIAGLRIDISKLKRAQIALSESERRLRDFAETSSDWFWEQDPDLRFTWISDSCPLLAADAADYPGKQRWDFPSASATPAEHWQQHRVVLAARQPFRDFRYALRDDQGRLRHVTVSGLPRFGEDGKFLGYRGTGRDVTAEVEAEAELREAKDRAEQAETMLHDAVDSISEGFVIYDADDRLVMWNDIYRQLCAPGSDVLVPGTRFEDVVRRVLKNGGHPDARGQEAAWLQQRLTYHQEAQGSMEEQLPGNRWILCTDRRMKNGGIAGLRIDITALKQAQAALHESEARLDRAQQIAGVGSWELDLQTGRYFWSKELYRIRGLSPDAFQPDIDNVALYVHPDDFPVVRRWLEDLRNGAERDTIEVRIVRPNGDVRTLHVEGRAVRDADGAVRRLSGTMQDITEKRLLEQQLAHSQRMEAIGKLTGGMAHDFNNVLGIVIGNLELLGRTVGDNKLALELQSEALEGARRGAELTRQMLAFARRQPLHPQQVEVNGLVEGLGRLLGRILGGNIELRLRLADVLPQVLVDPTQLEAAITNLATNARDAMPHGGRLEIATKTTSLDSAYALQHPEVRPGDYVLIEVSDTGAGIPQELLGRIFEPFFTTKEPGRGSGLGLAMVFGFMKQSGGHVSVYTEEHRGTTFRLYLPPAQQRIAPRIEAAAPVCMPHGSETVLVVEDNAALRRATVHQLKDLGYQVREAENGVAAMKFLQDGEKLDLLFTDVVMPGSMDGVELAQRATELRPGLKILLASGFPDARSTTSRTPAPSFPLINKPYRQEDLAWSFRKLLDETSASYANA